MLPGLELKHIAYYQWTKGGKSIIGNTKIIYNLEHLTATTVYIYTKSVVSTDTKDKWSLIVYL